VISLAFELFIKDDRINFYQRLLHIEQNSNNLFLVQDFPSAIFRDERLDKDRAKMQFRNSDEREKYLSISAERRINFENAIESKNRAITHIYNRESFRKFIEGKRPIGYPIPIEREQGQEQARGITRYLDYQNNFRLRLTARRLSIQGIVSYDSHEVLLQQPGEDQMLEGFYWKGESEGGVDKFKRYLDSIAESEGFNVDKQSKEERLELARWIRLLFHDDDHQSAVEELKNTLSGKLKDLLIPVLRLENINPEEIKLFYFGINSQLYPNTFHLLIFEPADLIEIYKYLPYVNKELFNKGYVNDILGYSLKDEDAISAQIFRSGEWGYLSDASIESGFPGIDKILGIQSTLYIPLGIGKDYNVDNIMIKEGQNQWGGVVLLTAPNRYSGESRIAKESLILKPDQNISEDSPCKNLKNAVELLFSDKLEEFNTSLWKTLQEYIACYNVSV